MGHKTIYAFFPYLRTRDRCRIRGLEFRSSNDLDGIDPASAVHIKALSQLFYTSQGGRILDPTFALVTGADEKAIASALPSLAEAQLLIGYLYGSPHPSPTVTDDIFLGAECWACYTFTPSQMIPASLATTTSAIVSGGRVAAEGTTPPPKDEFVAGYDGLRDSVVPLWVVAGSRVYPEIPHICLNHAQDLGADSKHFLSAVFNWPFVGLFRGSRLSAENYDRVFTSLLWHSRSCRSSADPIERLVSLAVALETLLALEKGDRVTGRFKEAVTTLVGPVPRLQEWLDQFYTARSGAVHDGTPGSLLFSIQDHKKAQLPHRSLIVYGRRIFRICMGATLSGIMLAKKAGLPTLLVHNTERLSEICKLLTGDGDASERLTSAADQIEDLHECATLTSGPRLEEDLDKLFGAGRLLIAAYFDCNRISIVGLDDQLKIFAASHETPSDLLKIYAAADMATTLLRKAVRVEGKGGRHDEIVLRFLEFAARPAVALECHRRIWEAAPPKAK